MIFNLNIPLDSSVSFYKNEIISCFSFVLDDDAQMSQSPTDPSNFNWNSDLNTQIQSVSKYLQIFQIGIFRDDLCRTFDGLSQWLTRCS